jgi:hypothetical protein
MLRARHDRIVISLGREFDEFSVLCWALQRGLEFGVYKV